MDVKCGSHFTLTTGLICIFSTFLLQLIKWDETLKLLWMILSLYRMPFFREDILTSHSRRSTGVNNKINDGWVPFSCFSFMCACWLAVSLSWLSGDRKEPSLMLLVTSVLFLLWQVKMSAVEKAYMYFWMTSLHLRRKRDWKRKDGKQKRPIPAVFCIWLGYETPTMSQFLMENMFFCELFSPIWFRLEHRPRGLVYSSVHHLRNQKYNSGSQFHCVIRYTDKSFLCLFASFVYLCQS